jgi:uncharacterized protein
MKIIFDTNVLLSAVFSPNSVTGKAFDKGFLMGDVICSSDTLAELIDVFSRPKFDKYISAIKRKHFVDDFVAAAIPIITERFETAICRDSKDEKFLELAGAANADYIVSGDKDLLVLNPFKYTLILTPREFLDLPI